MKKELVILVGNVGNGKSTLCKQLADGGYFIISKDDFRYSLGAGTYIFNINSEDAIHSASLKLMRDLMVQGFPLAIDETNMDIATRTEYIYFAKLYNYKTKAIILPKLSKEESVKRRLSSNHGNTTKDVWEEVWERKNEMFQEPSIQEGFDEVINYEI